MLSTIIIIQVIIFIHELGHLLVSKLLKIKVKTFSVGLGPTIFLKKYKDTVYKISLIPLGGYCLIDEKQLNKNSNLKRKFKGILISSAGSFYNIVFSFIILFCLFVFGYNAKNYPNEIVSNKEGILKNHDIILAINDKKVDDFNDISDYLILNRFKDKKIKILRDNKKIMLNIKKDQHLFIYPYIPLLVDNNTYLQRGDLITEVDNIKVYNILEYRKAIKDKIEIDLTYLRGQKQYKTHYIFDFKDEQMIDNIKFNIKEKYIKYSFSESIFYSYEFINRYIKLTFVSLKMLFLTDKKANDVFVGPFQLDKIINEVNEDMKESFLFWLTNILFLIANLSLSIAFLNMLPIPGFDGFKIMLYILL